MKKLTVALLLGIAITACSAGSPFRFADARRIELGMTTAQVEAKMGKPYSVRTAGNRQTWVWSQANGFSGKHSAVSFIFEDGKVIELPTIPASFD